MNQQLLEWLGARLPFPGLAAWSARLPDGTFARQCYVKWLVPPQVEQALVRLEHSSEALRHHKLENRRLCWSFEHLRLYLGCRKDGACLALFVENRAESLVSAAESLLEDFANQPN